MTTTYYGLPEEVIYCSKCTISNQRPSSSVEFTKDATFKKTTIHFDEHGVCSACNYAELKKKIDWDQRAEELTELCDRHRRGDGRFDCIVPGSGGKDSVVAAHTLKFRYNMNPLLITWPPALYTEPGLKNFQAWLDGGFTNITYNQNRKLHRFLTRNAFLNLGHPFQPFFLGQKNLAPKYSVLMDIPLVIYGENEAEYGNAIVENYDPRRDLKYYTASEATKDLVLGGVTVDELLNKHGFKLSDLDAYVPAEREKIIAAGTEVHYLGYYVKWHPQETYYFSVENSNFLPNDERTEGSYSRYSSIDDKIDWLHFHTMYAKFGLGRASYDSAQEIRNGDITRDEGIRLIRRFDGEYPKKYIADCCEYMGISVEEYDQKIDEIRSPHLWESEYGRWSLKYPIWSDS